MFSDSVLRNSVAGLFFDRLVSFSKACAYAFLSLVILLISAILRAHFIFYCSGGYFVGLLPRFSKGLEWGRYPNRFRRRLYD